MNILLPSIYLGPCVVKFCRFTQVIFVLILLTMAALDDVKQQLSALSVEDRRRAIADLDLADRIVVQATSSPKPRKLRLFSGRKPIPSGEVDFETWRLLVKQLEADDHISDGDKKLVVLQNLLRPALDAVKSCGALSEILDILDNLYGTIVDGQELLIRFHTTYQEDKESGSEYVQRIIFYLWKLLRMVALSWLRLPSCCYNSLSEVPGMRLLFLS